MKFEPLAVPDVILIEPRVFEDSRGFFTETYRKDVFSKNGIPEEFVQDNHSKSSKGVLRGLHYQIPPKSQAKLMRVTKGKVFDVAVDIRHGSKTFGKFVTCILSGENKKMLYVPAGFAHGFCVMEDDTEFVYKVSDFYSVEHERGILWNDPSIAIPWPAMDYIFSEKDKKHPLLKEAVLNK